MDRVEIATRIACALIAEPKWVEGQEAMFFYLAGPAPDSQFEGQEGDAVEAPEDERTETTIARASFNMADAILSENDKGYPQKHYTLNVEALELLSTLPETPEIADLVARLREVC